MTNQQANVLPYVRLQFHIDHPSLEDCWLDGYDVGQAEGAEEDNPHQRGSEEYEQWNQGWWAGFYNEERIYSQLGEIANVSHKAAAINAITQLPAANQSRFGKAELKKWAGRVAKVAGAIAVTVAAVELLDMAM